MHGLGNSQVILEDFDLNLEDDLDLEYNKIAKALCNPGFGIGADQMLVVLPSESADYRMRIFNRDGSEAEMCGNGIRCVGKYLFDKEMAEENLSIETLGGVKKLSIGPSDDEMTVQVDMGTGEILREKISVEDFKGTFVSMGNPFFVIFTEDASEELARKKGQALENAEEFQPDRANVAFAKTFHNNDIEAYVWERGAGFTLACGTGACATAFAAKKLGIIKNETVVKLPGGLLSISVDDSDRIKMSGPVSYVFEGEVFDAEEIFSFVDKLSSQ